MSGEQYQSRRHLNRVLAASSSTHSARAVLMVMCWRSDFERPEVSITKPQIAEATGLHLESIRLAFRFLADEGSIEVIRNALGGRGNAPRYRLQIAHKGANNLGKGANNLPPTIESIDSMSRRGSGGGARQWRGGQAEKKGAGGNRRALTQERKEKTERLNLAMKVDRGDYGRAIRLIAAWDAGEIPEGQPWP